MNCGNDYPPEFDGPDHCEVCGRSVSHRTTECDCPECPVCGEVGAPDCYTLHEMRPMHDSVASFCEHIGIAPLSIALRAIDKHSPSSVTLVFSDGSEAGPDTPRHLVEDFERRPFMRVATVRVSGIAWDGSDWEWADSGQAGNGWRVLDALRDDFDDALEEWKAETQDELET